MIALNAIPETLAVQVFVGAPTNGNQGENGCVQFLAHFRPRRIPSLTLSGKPGEEVAELLLQLLPRRVRLPDRAEDPTRELDVLGCREHRVLLEQVKTAVLEEHAPS